jgi:hypothetical protein
MDAPTTNTPAPLAEAYVDHTLLAEYITPRPEPGQKKQRCAGISWPTIVAALPVLERYDASLRAVYDGRKTREVCSFSSF